MAYRSEKRQDGKDDIVLYGIENGISPSPHLGIGSIQGENINTILGEASLNFERVNTIPVINASGAIGASSISGELTYTYVDGDTTYDKLVPGSALIPTNSTISGFSTDTSAIFWVWSIVSDDGSTQTFNYSTNAYYQEGATLGSTGTADCVTKTPSKVIEYDYEWLPYLQEFRYFFVDEDAFVWVLDTNLYDIFTPVTATNITQSSLTVIASGLAVANNCVVVFASIGGLTPSCYAAPSNGANILDNWTSCFTVTSPGYLNNSVFENYALSTVAENTAIFYCDGNNVGEISISQSAYTSGEVAPQSLLIGTYSDSSSVITAEYLAGQTIEPGVAVHPYITDPGGSLDSVFDHDVMYVVSESGGFGLATTAGGTAVTPTSNGTVSLITFWPNNSATCAITYNAIKLSGDDTSTCLEQIAIGGTLTIVVGTNTNRVYFWQLDDEYPNTVLLLPESETHRILNVDNNPYIFTGNKGNIYVTNGTTIAGALTLPDYMANQYGNNQDPYYVWGDVMFLRGRVWFSICDETSTHAGNCGGIWSFVPTQNLFIGEDQGIRLCEENQSSYGSYDGYVTTLIPLEIQTGNGPQYYSCWSEKYNDEGDFGVDFSGTKPESEGIIEWDIIPIGTYLPPFTPSNIEYKISRPLQDNESVSIYYRTNLTDTFTLIGTDSTTGNTAYPFQTNFQNAQWLQLKTKTVGANNGSYVPITELRIRP